MVSSSKPIISIIIPVKNGDTWLPKTLDAILNQTLIAKAEIIVIDSGSTDNTLSILFKYPVRIIHIPSAEFNHGATRNLGVREAKGKYVVMTVQDAQPVNENWLQHLLDGFIDETVAGVCGQQIVPHHKDKNPVDWFRPISQPGKKKYYYPNPNDFVALNCEDKKRVCSWDNVNAMYKREALMSFPFEEVMFAEDALWAKNILLNGFSIVYNTTAQVYHYHYETPDFTFKRTFTTWYHMYKFFLVKPSMPQNNVVSLLKNFKLLVGEKNLGFEEKIKWMIFNHRQRKAVKEAYSLFSTCLEKGEEYLVQKHDEVCKKAPQAIKPTI